MLYGMNKKEFKENLKFFTKKLENFKKINIFWLVIVLSILMCYNIYRSKNEKEYSKKDNYSVRAKNVTGGFFGGETYNTN